MTQPSIIVSLSPQGELITELPGLNGSRRKINLHKNQKSTFAIGFAMQVLDEITNINSVDVSDLKSQLENKISNAREAINLLSTIQNQDNTLTDIIFHILDKQQTSKHSIGEDGAPTASQLNHWEKHGILCEDENCEKNKKGIAHSHQSNISDPSCSHCKSEGRFEPGYNREKTPANLKNLSINEALKLGLIHRGYIQSKSNPDIWNKKNMAAVRLLSNGKIFNSKNEQWSKSNHLELIADGKLHAIKINFQPQDFKPHTNGGAKVRKLVKKVENKSQKSTFNSKNLVASMF